MNRFKLSRISKPGTTNLETGENGEYVANPEGLLMLAILCQLRNDYARFVATGRTREKQSSKRRGTNVFDMSKHEAAHAAEFVNGPQLDDLCECIGIALMREINPDYTRKMLKSTAKKTKQMLNWYAIKKASENATNSALHGKARCVTTTGTP